jgi:hypothetical protein
VKIISDIVDDECDIYPGRIDSLLARNPLPSRIRRQFFPEESEFPTTQAGKKNTIPHYLLRLSFEGLSRSQEIEHSCQCQPNE